MPIASVSLQAREDVRAWMIATQLGRRNLTPEQKSYLRGKRYNLEKKKEGAPQGNQNATKRLSENQTVASEPTRERLAEEYGVAPSTISEDAALAEAVDTLDDQVRADIREAILTRQRNGSGATTKKHTVTAAKAIQAHIWEWDSGHGAQTMVSAHAHRPGRCLGRDPQRVEDVSLDWEEQGF